MCDFWSLCRPISFVTIVRYTVLFARRIFCQRSGSGKVLWIFNSDTQRMTHAIAHVIKKIVPSRCAKIMEIYLTWDWNTPVFIWEVIDTCILSYATIGISEAPRYLEKKQGGGGERKSPRWAPRITGGKIGSSNRKQVNGRGHGKLLCCLRVRRLIVPVVW